MSYNLITIKLQINFFSILIYLDMYFIPVMAKQN